jgi:hypothetical protein
MFPIAAQFDPICVSNSMYVDGEGPKGNMTMLVLGVGGAAMGCFYLGLPNVPEKIVRGQ